MKKAAVTVSKDQNRNRVDFKVPSFFIILNAVAFAICHYAVTKTTAIVFKTREKKLRRHNKKTGNKRYCI